MQTLLPTIPISNPAGSADHHYPVRRIICIARNYADHAREMGHNPEREPPFFFYKPLTALALGESLALPDYSQDVQYELELVLTLGSGGRHLTPVQAKASVNGFALGLDMTARDSQKNAKAAGQPWELAKGFDGAARTTPIESGGYDRLETLGEMTLSHNGATVQRGHWRDMIWSVPELIGYVSRFTELGAGDIIYTGTPAGVGPVQAGDRLEARMEGFAHTLSLAIKAPV